MGLLPYAGKVFAKHQHQEDFVGGIDEVFGSVTEKGKRFLFIFRAHRNVIFIFAPYYISQMFKYAEDYTQIHGFEANDPKDKIINE